MTGSHVRARSADHIALVVLTISAAVAVSVATVGLAVLTLVP